MPEVFTVGHGEVGLKLSISGFGATSKFYDRGTGRENLQCNFFFSKCDDSIFVI